MVHTFWKVREIEKAGKLEKMLEKRRKSGEINYILYESGKMLYFIVNAK